MKIGLIRMAMLLGIVTVPSFGYAQDVVAGWEGDGTHGYAFVAPTAAFAVTRSQSILLRTTGSFLYYASQIDAPTDVTAPGASGAFGYRLSRPRLSASFFAGFEVRRVHRLHVPGPTHMWERGLSLSGDAFIAASSLTRVSVLANYGQANQYSWIRAGVQQQVSNRDFQGRRAISLGAELTAQGNRDVSSYQLGGVLETAWLGARTSLQIRGGYSESHFSNDVSERKPYLGIGLYRHL